MATPVYAFCENNCRYETMRKEEIFSAIAQAIETGTVGECDTGFITTIKTVNGVGLRFFVGTQSEYNALSAETKKNLFALITNDTTKDGLLRALEELREEQNNINNVFNSLMTGASVVAEAKHALTADYAENAKYRELVWSNEEYVEKSSLYVDIGNNAPNGATYEIVTHHHGTHTVCPADAQIVALAMGEFYMISEVEYQGKRQIWINADLDNEELFPFIVKKIYRRTEA